MNRCRVIIAFTVLLFAAGMNRVAAGEAPLRVLIFSGQNNHNWRETTPKLRSILEASGHFTVEVTEHPEQCEGTTLGKYDVLLSNWNTFGEPTVTNWPLAARQAFLDFVRNGKGFVSVHAGSSSFYDWPEYQQLAGGAWKLGRTGHGPVHEFLVEPVRGNHPVTLGLTNFLMTDELWHQTDLQPDVTILATAFSAKEKGGTGQNEPVAFAKSFGQGRCFNLLLGHHAMAMDSAGFQALLRRGTEWAATGSVKTTTGERQPADCWVQTATRTACYHQGGLLWEWTTDPADAKPCFHPLATAGGAVLTALRPADHPWHRGLWWSWKFIDGVNYWEEDPQTGRSAGRTEIVSHRARQTPAGDTEIKMILAYHPEGKAPVLKETRSIRVSAPDREGDYAVDWEAEFAAVGEMVKLDRTPLGNESGGQSWGGYAGLSLRLDASLTNGVFRNSEGQVGVPATHGQPARWMDCSTPRGGVAVFDHPRNPRHPNAWYVNQEMPFFSPALLFNAPEILRANAGLRLRYRLLIHSQPKTVESLEAAWRLFSRE